MNTNAGIKTGIVSVFLFFFVLSIAGGQQVENFLEIVSDLNKDLNISDQNLNETPLNENFFEVDFKAKLVSPVYGEQIKGKMIVILAIEPKEKIVRAFFEIGQFRQDLLAENNFSTEFDSFLLEDGVYDFNATVCSEVFCMHESIPVEIQNDSMPRLPIDQNSENNDRNGFIDSNIFDANTPLDQNFPVDSNKEGTQKDDSELEPVFLPENFVKIKGSNILAALTLFNLDESIAGSGTEEIGIEPRIYNAQLDFFEFKLTKIFLEKAKIDASTTLMEITNYDDFLQVQSPPVIENKQKPDTKTQTTSTEILQTGQNFVDATVSNNGLPQGIFEWVKLYAFKPNVVFEKASVFFELPSSEEFLFKCSHWSLEEKKCLAGFEKFEQSEQDEQENPDFFELTSQPMVFGFAQEKRTITEDLNMVIDENKIKELDENTQSDANIAVGDLLGIDFTDTSRNLPAGIYFIQNFESRQDFDQSVFPYNAISENPQTRKKRLLMNFDKSMQAQFFSGLPATKLASIQELTEYEFFFTISWPQNSLYEIDYFDVMAIEFDEKDVMGKTGDIVHFNGLQISPASTNYTVSKLEQENSIKLKIRFETSANAKFMRFLFIFGPLFPNAQNTQYFLEDIFLKKAEKNEQNE